jgi:hypothetical protein
LVFDSAKGTVFVGNKDSSGNSTVSVISDNDHTVIATVGVGIGPGNLAYDPRKGQIFVPCDQQVSIISDETNTLVDTQNGYAGVSGAHDAANGISFYSGFKDGTAVVWVVSDSTHEVIANLTLLKGGVSYDIVFDSEKGVAYAGDGNVTVYAISDSSLPSVSYSPTLSVSASPSPIATVPSSSTGDPENNSDSKLNVPIEVIDAVFIIAALAIVVVVVLVIRGRKRIK